MNVIYATDENYAMYTGISIYSLYDNNKDLENLDVHILDNGVVEQSKQYLIDIANKFDREISFYDGKGLFDELAKSIKMKNTQTITTYASCYLSGIMPESMETAIYVDGDSLFLGSLKELEETQMDDYYIAGCIDNCLPAVRKAIGLEIDEPYINAGFLYMNFKKIRDADLGEEIAVFIRDVIPTSLHNDQDVVNGVLGKKMKVLPAKYCVLTPVYERKYSDIVNIFKLTNYYSKEEIEDAVKNPVFVHFTPSATKRPWVKGCNHPKKKDWDYYKNLTPWKDVADKKDKRKLKKKVLDWMFRNLNIELYKKITKLAVKIKG